MAQAEAIMAQLNRRQVRLWLLQAALLMSMEGISRAQVSEVVSRAEHEYGVETSPWEAGQIFSSLGIRTVSSHGRSRLVLEQPLLKDLHDQAREDAEALKSRVEESVAHFDGIFESVTELEVSLDRVIEAAKREQQITQFLRESRSIESRAASAEQRYKDMKARADRADKLEAAIKGLQQKLRSLAPLEKRRKKLTDAIEAYEQEEKALSHSEKALASRINHLKERSRWVSVAQLDEAIDEATQELELLSEQLGEKRSLLSRVLGKQKQD